MKKKPGIAYDHGAASLSGVRGRKSKFRNLSSRTRRRKRPMIEKTDAARSSTRWLVKVSAPAAKPIKMTISDEEDGNGNENENREESKNTFRVRKKQLIVQYQWK
jgi:hypothetical protein